MFHEIDPRSRRFRSTGWSTCKGFFWKPLSPIRLGRFFHHIIHSKSVIYLLSERNPFDGHLWFFFSKENIFLADKKSFCLFLFEKIEMNLNWEQTSEFSGGWVFGEGRQEWAAQSWQSVLHFYSTDKRAAISNFRFNANSSSQFLRLGVFRRLEVSWSLDGLQKWKPGKKTLAWKKGRRILKQRASNVFKVGQYPVRVFSSRSDS